MPVSFIIIRLVVSVILFFPLFTMDSATYCFIYVKFPLFPFILIQEHNLKPLYILFQPLHYPVYNFILCFLFIIIFMYYFLIILL